MEVLKASKSPSIQPHIMPPWAHKSLIISGAFGMSSPSFPSLLFAGACVVFLWLVTVVVRVFYYSDSKRLPLPPGPKPRFLVGNAFDIPLRKASKVYHGWSKVYDNKIIHLYGLGKRLVVLNSLGDAEVILERHARVSSDRPHFPTLDLIGWDNNFSFFRYGKKWRYHRRISQQSFRADSADKYNPIIYSNVQRFLVALLDIPERFDDHNKVLSLSIPLEMGYGYQIKTIDDPLITTVDEFIALGVQMFSPGGSLVHIFPWWRYIPWTWTWRTSSRAIELSEKIKRIPLEALYMNLSKGYVAPSLVSEFLERKEAVGASEAEECTILNIANTIYGAASETTMSSTKTFLYILATHPQIQYRAQEELDKVIGHTPCIPTLEERSSLPYIEAILREILRWSPPLPTAVGHYTAEDIWYQGYVIPKETTIIANVWAMTHDEDLYKDPMVFNPERFLDADGGLNNDDRILAFGFGRRACVGKHVALNMLWVALVSTLSAFTITKSKDSNGNDIEIDDEFEEIGIVECKTPFKCDIKPRSEGWRNVIETMRKEIQ